MRKIKFTLDKVVFKSSDNDFKICRVYPIDSDVVCTSYGNVSIKGLMTDMRRNVVYNGIISSEEKSEYGYTYQVIGVAPDGIGEVNSDDEMVKFIELSMSKPMAKKINVKGINDIIKNQDIESLSKIKGVGVKTARKIINIWIKLGINSKYITELLSLGFKDNHITSINSSFPNLEIALAEIKKDPYILLYKKCSIRMDVIDKIATEKMNIESDDIRRVKALLYYVINEISYKDFKSYITLRELVDDDRFSNLLHMVGNEVINFSLKELIKDNIIKRIDNNVGLVNIYNNEMELVQNINRISKHKDNRFDDIDIDKMILDEEVKLGFKLTDEQKEAVKVSLSSNFTLIQGNAGTGKTSIVKVVLNIIERVLGSNTTFTLCALSGKASQVVSQSTGRNASTIHRLIGFDEGDKIHTDVLVVDELSMVDIDLFRRLLKSTYTKTKVIVMGDNKQLPSLQYGKMIQDLMLFDDVKIVSLTQVHRQALESGIILVATDIRQDRCPIPTSGEYTLGNLKDMHIINEGSLMNRAIDKAIELYDKDDIENMQVLCATNNMCYKVNRKIQESVIDLDSEYIEVRAIGKITKYGDKIPFYNLHINDKIIIVKNKYNVMTKDEYIAMNNDDDAIPDIQGSNALFNGNIGYIEEINNKDKYVVVNIQGESYVLEENDYKIIQLGYAISCHKSQGSGSNDIIVLLEGSYVENMICSNEWLYTAITRAKKQCYLYSPFGTIINGVKKRAVNKKTTFIDLVL